MKLADFVGPDGDFIELDFTGKDIPRTVEHEGKTYKRAFRNNILIDIPEHFGDHNMIKVNRPPLEGEFYS